jgi:hypothetical protein
MAEKKDKYKSSFGVIRANPRISGNLKITVDSGSNIWLNSIDSNDEMSKNQYKGYRISPDGDFSQDVYNFFNKGKTPTNFIFGIKNEDKQRETYTSSLDLQYDGFYHMGVTPLISDVYPEDFSYLAPMWVGNDIPKYFVIFRVDDPIDFSYLVKVTNLEVGKNYKVLEDYGVNKNSTSYQQYQVKSANITYSAGTIFTATATSFSTVSGNGSVILLDGNYNKQFVGDIQNHFVDNILPKSSIVATFSLQDDSKIGKYIRRIQSNANYTQSLIDIKFEQNSLSTYNGVSVKDGVYTKKGEYLNSNFTTDSTVIELDQIITDGFKRNDIVSYNLLNLEFLFTDEDADLYTINRYYGLYVDDIPTGNFKLSGESFYQDSLSKGNFPEPKSATQISEKMTSSFYQSNDNGVRLFIDPLSKWGYIPTSDDIHTNDRLKVFYLKDKNYNFHSYKQIKDYQNSATSEDKWGTGTSQEDIVILKNKILDLSIFSGIDQNKTKEYRGILTNTGGRSYSTIKITGELTPNDAIVFYHPFGNNSIGNRRYDYFVASDLTYVKGGWGPGSFSDEGGAYYFHPFGTNEQIASAITGVLNSVNYKSYKAFNTGNEIVIRTEGSDTRNDEMFSLFVYKDFYNKSTFVDSGKIYFNGVDGKDLTEVLDFIGGSIYTNTRIKITNLDASKLSVDRSYVKTNFGLSKIKFIGKCIDYDPSEVQFNTIKDYDTHSIIEIENNTHTILIGSNNTIVIEELINIESGVFSMYGLKDLDIDFWSSNYGKTPTEEYYRYIDIQPDGITPIIEGIDYAVASGATVKYMGNTYGPSSNFIFRGGTETSYTLIESSTAARANVVPTLFVNSITNAQLGINDPLVDIDKFPGFLGLQDIKFLNDTSSILTKKDQMYFGKVDSEYDVLKENYIRNLSNLSRVTPYITKWVYQGGIDVRGNDYRLNASPAFTPLNFSPSFFSPGRDPLYFTNEWYLLENPPILATKKLLADTNSYCTGSVSLASLQNADPSEEDYFVNYFTIDGDDYYNLDAVKFSGIESKRADQRYTYFTYDSASGFSETIFRGVKVRIKERTDTSLKTKERNLFKSGDQKFKGYKFSCILKSIDDPDPYSITPPVTFSVHQNDTFKNVTFIITVTNNDLRFVDFEKLSDSLYNTNPDADLLFTTAIGSWYYNPTGIYGGSDYFGLYSISNKYRHTVTGSSSLSERSKLIAAEKLSSIIGNVKLSAGLNITNRATIGISPYVGYDSFDGSGIIPIIVNSEYGTDLREEVKFYSPSTPVLGTSTRPSFYRSPYTLFSPKPNDPGSYWEKLPWPTGVGKNYLNFNEVNPASSYTFDFTNLGYSPPLFTRVPIPVSYNSVKNKAVYQFASGENYWESVFNKISFPEIYKLFLEDNGYIKYTRSYWNSTTSSTVIEQDTYVLEFIKPSSFVQNSRKIPLEDNYKPEKYSNTFVGYQLIEERSVTEFFRYGGGYSPKFIDVLPFSNIKNDYLSSDRSNPTSLDITISIRQKIKGDSKFFGIGSDYEILIDGSPRKKLRLVKGNTYNFIFDNFRSTSFVGSYPIKKNFIISLVENSGETQNLYTTKYALGTTSSVFTVPQDVQSEIYYELEGENFSGGSATVVESLEYKNTTFGTNKDSFGTIKNINFYKYAKSNPFGIDPNSGYKLQYPLIGETPIDRRDLFIFESTWDAGRYQEYLAPTAYQYLPGTKNMVEQKSFLGSKVMKTPGLIKEPFQLKYPSSISDVFNVNPDLYPKYEITWEETDTEIKALLLINRTVIKHFQEGGIDKRFSELLVSEFGIGNETILTDDVDEYVKNNVLPQYEAKEINIYIKKIQITPGIDLQPIITDLSDHQKISNGFLKSTNNNITKRTPLEYEFRLKKDPSFDYSVAFSFLVGKI